MTTNSGICLEQDGVVLADAFEAVNARLGVAGIRVWPVDLGEAPADVRRLLAKPTLTGPEAERVRAHFLLPRARLLEVIAAAGRAPHLPDGGELDTWCWETETAYPQLHVIDKSIDYSGFFPFHVNVADDGSGTDEVGHVLSGGPMRYRYRLATGDIVTLSLTCPRPEQGWLFTFDGGAPHGGILDDTEAGTKVLVQAIGPKRFHLRYVT
jgi:hypothetical protein